jgi:hypothetical protein
MMIGSPLAVVNLTQQKMSYSFMQQHGAADQGWISFAP